MLVLKELKNCLFLLMVEKTTTPQKIVTENIFFQERQLIIINNYNIEIDGRNFYDQPINNLIKQYEEVRKISTGQGDDHGTGCLLDYVYFKDDFRLITVDLSKQKALDADPKAI